MAATLRKYLIFIFLLIATPAFSVPNNSMSITPSASDGAVITSSDENTRNTNISTPYNAHSHTDITPDSIADADGNTQIQTEESTNEDIIRMDTAGTQRWIMTAAGERTMPTQPYVNVQNSAEQTNFAIDAAVVIVLDTENFDIGANFASNTFTCPVTGKYPVFAMVNITNMDTAADNYSITINTSNRNYATLLDPGQFAGDVTGQWPFVASEAVDCDASDTITIDIRQNGGTQQSDITAGNALVTIYLSI